MGGGYYFFKPKIDKLRANLDAGSGAGLVAKGQPADYDGTVTDLEGKSRKVADFKGKVVFLNFWATWCRPCLMELPSIQKLHAQFKDRDVAFVIVSEETPDVLKAFAGKAGQLRGPRQVQGPAASGGGIAGRHRFQARRLSQRPG